MYPFCVRISASLSRGEVSCRRGGSAGPEDPFIQPTHAVQFISPDPKSASRNIYRHGSGGSEQGRVGREVVDHRAAEELLLFFLCSHIVAPNVTEGLRSQHFSPLRDSAAPSFTRSPAPALGEETRGLRE